MFPEHHDEIEALCKALRVSVYADDPQDVITRYRMLEHAVLEHLRAEEDSILPAYGHHAPGDAAAIYATHDELRRRLFRIGVDAELHCARVQVVDDLIAALRAHAAHEDGEMYPWAEVNLPVSTKRQLFARMARSLCALAFDIEKAPIAKQPSEAE